MVRPSHMRTITPAEFKRYAAEHGIELTYPAPLKPQPKGADDAHPEQTLARAIIDYLLACPLPDGDENGSALSALRTLGATSGQAIYLISAACLRKAFPAGDPDHRARHRS